MENQKLTVSIVLIIGRIPPRIRSTQLPSLVDAIYLRSQHYVPRLGVEIVVDDFVEQYPHLILPDARASDILVFWLANEMVGATSYSRASVGGWVRFQLEKHWTEHDEGCWVVIGCDKPCVNAICVCIYNSTVGHVQGENSRCRTGESGISFGKGRTGRIYGISDGDVGDELRDESGAR